MIVLVWIAWIVVATLAFAIVVTLGALVARVSIEGRVGPDGVAADGRWGLIRVAAYGAGHHGAGDTVVVRLLGIRLPGVWLPGGDRRDASKEDEAKGSAAEDRAGDAAQKKRAKETTPGARRSPSLLGYRRLVALALRELRASARHLHVEQVRIDAVIATDDPALTGEAYGLGMAVGAWFQAAWPTVQLSLTPDFVATRPRVHAEAALHFRPVRFVPGAVRVGWAYWTERRRTRRRASGAAGVPTA